MSYKLKYYNYFRNIENEKFKFEIYQNTTNTVTATEIVTDVQPFILKYNSIKKIYDNIHTSEATLNLISSTNQQFINLYTFDMLEYKTRFYKVNSGFTITNNLWTGYLNSEIYSEPFDSDTNYDVQITANDGFNVLKRIKFLDANGNKYTTILSAFDIIKIIFSKIFISDIDYVYTAFSTTFTNFTVSAGENILHKIYLNTNNYIDEEGVVMSCREVLESILSIFDGYCKFENNSLYITDWNTIASTGTTTFNKYNNSFTYISTSSINLNKGDIKNIRVAQTGQQLDIKPGINNQKLSYSPYEQNSIFEIEPNFQTLGSTVEYGTDNSEYKWKMEYYSTDETFTHGTGVYFCKKIGTGTKNLDKTEVFYKFHGLNDVNYDFNFTQTGMDGLLFKYPLPYLVANSTYKLKIEANAYCNTRTYFDKPNDPYTYIYSFILFANVKIGNYYLTSSGQWSTTYENIMLGFGQKDYWNNSSDQWFEVKGYDYITPDLFTTLNSNLNGFLEIKFSKYAYVEIDGTQLGTQDVYLKNFKMSIVDEKGNEISDKDVEYISKLNPLFENEGSAFKTLHGTNVNNSITAKGTIYYKNGSNYYIPITTANRGGQTKEIEKLLLNSIQSNYQGSTVIYKCTLNNTNNFLGCFTYASQIAGKKFFPVGYIIDYAYNKVELNLNEINNDNLTII